MYLLDRDICRAFLGDRGARSQLTRRILATPPEALWISVVSTEEALRGALSLVHQRRHTPRVIEAYAFFDRVLTDLLKFNRLPYDENAEQLYQAMPPSVKRIGVQDCRIAASALARGFTVVTRNLRDFQRIGVPCEDWTA